MCSVFAFVMLSIAVLWSPALKGCRLWFLVYVCLYLFHFLIINYYVIGLTDKVLYYIPINDTTLELSVFWPSDTESRINELRFSESISLSFKTRLTSVTCFCGGT